MVPRASRQGCVVPLTARRLDQGAMPLLLQREIRRVKIRDERAIWFRDKGIRIQRSGTRYNFLMRPDSPTLCSKEVVISIDLVEMRALDELDIRPAVDSPGRHWLHLHRRRVEFCQRDAVERMMVFPMIPGLLYQILPAIIVMEQRRIKTDSVQSNRVRPRACDALGRRQVVRHVLEGTFRNLDICIDEPEFPICVSQVRCPDTPRRWIALHVEERRRRQRRRQQFPVDHILRFVKAYTGEPFKGRIGDIIGISYTNHAGISMEARQYGVLDFHIISLFLLNSDSCTRSSHLRAWISRLILSIS